MAKIDIKEYLLEGINKINLNVKNLDSYRFNNVIRFWVKKNNFRMPALSQIESIYRDVFLSGKDKSPFFKCSEY